jgi:hypothetical protein
MPIAGHGTCSALTWPPHLRGAADAKVTRRLYFVLPDLYCAARTAHDLWRARVDDQNMFFVGRDDMPLGRLNAASVTQTSDLTHSLRVGATVGLRCGALLGTLLMMVPPPGLNPGAGTIAICAFFGALFGSWAASLVGVSVPSPQLAPFQRDIERGRIVMMVDVPPERVAEIEQLVQGEHPDVTRHGLRPPRARFGGAASP